jgi:HopJ type III effector protein
MHNAADANQGSAKILSFGQLTSLDERATLRAFGQHYVDVVADPAGDSHGNIRNFMLQGWAGVEFPEGLALAPKQ